MLSKINDNNPTLDMKSRIFIKNVFKILKGIKYFLYFRILYAPAILAAAIAISLTEYNDSFDKIWY